MHRTSKRHHADPAPKAREQWSRGNGGNVGRKEVVQYESPAPPAAPAPARRTHVSHRMIFIYIYLEF